MTLHYRLSKPAPCWQIDRGFRRSAATEALAVCHSEDYRIGSYKQSLFVRLKRLKQNV